MDTHSVLRIVPPIAENPRIIRAQVFHRVDRVSPSEYYMGNAGEVETRVVPPVFSPPTPETADTCVEIGDVKFVVHSVALRLKGLVLTSIRRDEMAVEEVGSANDVPLTRQALVKPLGALPSLVSTSLTPLAKSPRSIPLPMYPTTPLSKQLDRPLITFQPPLITKPLTPNVTGSLETTLAIPQIMYIETHQDTPLVTPIETPIELPIVIPIATPITITTPTPTITTIIIPFIRHYHKLQGSPEVFVELLRWVYSAEETWSVNARNYAEVLVIAYQVGAWRTLDECRRVLESEADLVVCLRVYDETPRALIAGVQCVRRLHDSARRLLLIEAERSKNMPGLLRLPYARFRSLIYDDELNVADELSVLVLVVNWLVGQRTPYLEPEYAEDLLAGVRWERVRNFNTVGALYRDARVWRVPGARRAIDRHHRRSLVYGRRWTGCRRLRVPRRLAEMRPRISRHLVFASGGWRSGRSRRTPHVFDPAARRWYSPLELRGGHRNYGGRVGQALRRPPAVSRHVAACLDRSLYAYGGVDADKRTLNALLRYDPRTGECLDLANMLAARCSHFGVACLGMLYAFGGKSSIDQPSLSSCERYDPISDEWTAVSRMPRKMCDAGCAALNGAIYICGGDNTDSPMVSTYRYDTSEDQWTRVSNMMGPRCDLCLVALSGRVYAIGGRRGDSTLSRVESYDPVTNVWTREEPCIHRRSNFGACEVNGKILIAGGFNGSRIITGTECYSPNRSPRWRSTGNLAKPTSGLRLVKVSNLENRGRLGYYGHRGITTRLRREYVRRASARWLRSSTTADPGSWSENGGSSTTDSDSE